jgi:GTPase SAR1 family protein
LLDVGKTTMHNHYFRGTTSHYSCTVGIDFAQKELTLDEHTTKLQIWDTAGAER